MSIDNHEARILEHYYWMDTLHLPPGVLVHQPKGIIMFYLLTFCQFLWRWAVCTAGVIFGMGIIFSFVNPPPFSNQENITIGFLILISGAFFAWVWWHKRVLARLINDAVTVEYSERDQMMGKKEGSSD